MLEIKANFNLVSSTNILLVFLFVPILSSAQHESHHADQTRLHSLQEKCEVENAAAINAVENSLNKIKALNKQLQKKRLILLNRIMFPQFESERQRQALHYWQEITAQTIFTRTKMRETEEQIDNLQDAIARGDCTPAYTSATHLEAKLKRQLANFKAAEFLFEAKTEAEAAKADLVMYRMMKSVKGPAPKADHAHHLYAQAQANMDKGELAEAVINWRAATKAFNEDAFREVIEGFKKHGDDATENANRQLEAIRNKTLKLLDKHFVSIPAGTFLMGSHTGDIDERPVHSARVSSFTLGRTEIPFALWDLCAQTRLCLRKPDDEGWGRAQRPVVNISYDEITEQFIPWLSLMTGKKYRLPTEEEWEYAARAGSTSRYHWGDTINCDQARYKVSSAENCSNQESNNTGTYPIKIFSPNQFGVFDMHGNVWEWTDSCYTQDYSENKTKASESQCQVIAVRGGSWKDRKDSLRSANRFYFPKTSRISHFGFRVVELAN